MGRVRDRQPDPSAIDIRRQHRARCRRRRERWGTLEEAGVEFHGESFDSGVCHGAPFTDAVGNPLQLHHRYAPLESWEPPPGEFERTDFIGVPVTDRPQGVGFYGGTLGLKRNERSSDEWPEFEPGNATILLNTPEQTGDTFRAGNYSIALRVSDVAATMDRLRGAGVEFEYPQVYDSSVCHMAFFRDPTGTR